MYSDLLLHLKKDHKEDICIVTEKRSICKHSEFIKNLLAEKEKTKMDRKLIDDVLWPPISELAIEIPHNIDSDDVARTIHYFSDKENIIINKEMVVVSQYLQIKPSKFLDMIRGLLKKHIDKKTFYLDADSVDSLLYIFKNCDKDLISKIVAYYYPDIRNVHHDFQLIDDTKYFTQEISIDKNKCADYKWIHIPSNQYPELKFNSLINFEAFGVNWEINRFTHCFNEDDMEDYVKIYAKSEEFNKNSAYDTKMSIQCHFFIYTLESFHKKRTEVVEMIPREQEHEALSHSCGRQHLYLTLGDDGLYHKKFRLSMLLKKIK